MTEPASTARKPAKKRRKAIRASALSRAEFEKLGYEVGFVERFIHHIKRRIDLFGFIDLIAFKATKPGVVGIQSCAIDRWADHRATICENKRAVGWLRAGNRICLIGWERSPSPGGRYRRKHEWITLETIAGHVPRIRKSELPIKPKTTKTEKPELIRY